MEVPVEVEKVVEIEVEVQKVVEKRHAMETGVETVVYVERIV